MMLMCRLRHTFRLARPLSTARACLNTAGVSCFAGASPYAAGAAVATAAFVASMYASEDHTKCSSWSGSEMALVMAGDCGGTNTRLQIFKVPLNATLQIGQSPPGELLFAKKYLNNEFPSFQAVCEKFLEEAAPLTGGSLPRACCLACAGAISNNTVEFTNVAKGWSINGSGLEQALGIKRVVLINDFVAQGYGLLTLASSEKTLLNDATPVAGAPIACVGAGTGLGECYLTMSNDGTYACWPSEGGHIEFSPRNELTTDMLIFLKRKFEDKKRVSVERVVSGTGIANIYEFLREHWAFKDRLDPEIDAAFVAAPPHKQAVVVSQGHAAGDATCTEALLIFKECYGAEVGNAVLKWLPKAGMYVSGGIAAKNPDWIKSETFLSAYASKGRLSPQLAQTPLYVVLVEDTGERGAHFQAVQTLLSTK